MKKTIVVKIGNTSYEAHITYKRIRAIYIRFKNGAFHISAPYLTTQKSIVALLNKHAVRLLKRCIKEHPIGDDYIYFFGKKETMPLQFDKDACKIDLKEELYKYANRRLRELEAMMHIPLQFKLKIKDVTTRLGSNSRRTNTITLALKLVHYSQPIIDSVIYHELTHYFYFDHSSNFYRILLSYCPDYKSLRYKILRGIYE